jgi:ubiquinone/menaquinone biosynthesis C-methylase UbiE
MFLVCSSKIENQLSMGIIQTAERVSQKDLSDNYVFQRSLLAYVEAAHRVSGNVLEIGTGNGYGAEIISPGCDSFTTIDKYESEVAKKNTLKNVSFIQMNVPPFVGIEDNSFDFVISFQVIEHIKNDKQFVKEVYRVLKKGGKFIVSTPNIRMSITRNPWHVREYTSDELESLLLAEFQEVEKMGVAGNDKIMDYYSKNKKSVEKITRFDIFNLQYNMPRFLLQIPYDILNRINRRKLLKNNTSLVSDIKMDDYQMVPVHDQCFDLFYIALKK